MKKNRFLKKLTLFGLVALIVLTLASVASAATDDFHLNVLTQYSIAYEYSFETGLNLNNFHLSVREVHDGLISNASNEWNGLTLAANHSGTVANLSISGTAGEADAASFALVASSDVGPQLIVIRRFTIMAHDDTLAWANGTALNPTQMTISDEDGGQENLTPGLVSTIEIPIVGRIDDGDLFGVFVTAAVSDDADLKRLGLPHNSDENHAAKADGYYYTADAGKLSGKLTIHYRPSEAGRYTFDIYYKQDGTSRLRRQQIIINAEKPTDPTDPTDPTNPTDPIGDGDIYISSNFIAFTGWNNIRMKGDVRATGTLDLSKYKLTIGTDGNSTATTTEWNGFTVGVAGTQVYVTGSSDEPGSAIFTVVATRAETATVSEDVKTASFSVDIIDEDSTMPSGAALNLSQIKISDKNGEHRPSYLVPGRYSVITIPIVENIDADDIFGVYIHATRDDYEKKVALPDNSWTPETSSDGYYYNVATKTLQINYHPELTGDYTFRIYYYDQGGTLRMQSLPLGVEIPGGDSGSGGCATGVGLVAIVLAAGVAILRRKR